jgi:hypothetical protein
MEGQSPRARKTDPAKPNEESATGRTESAVPSAQASGESSFDFLARPQAADENWTFGALRVLRD